MKFYADTMKDVTVRTGQVGGDTFYYRGAAYCMRRSANGYGVSYCASKAGAGTNHVGTGACHQHGGAITERSVKAYSTTRYQVKNFKAIGKHYQAFITDPNMLDLSPELALLRAILQEEMQLYQPGTKHVRFLVDTIMKVSDMVMSIEKIQSQQVLTAASSRALLLRGFEVAQHFIDDDDQLEQFITMWSSDPVIGMGKFLPPMVEIEANTVEGEYEPVGL